MDTRLLKKDFAKLLKKRHEEFRPFFMEEETDCYRVYNWNIADLPWFVDFYGNYLHIVSFTRTHNPELARVEEELLDTAGRMLYVPRERIVFKHRFIQGKYSQQEKLDDTSNFMKVRESGLLFRVNLLDYMDTGLFPDHRLSRRMLRETVYGRRLLNLFGYTGAFTVYAAAGGAASSVTVDLSSRYLSWARENMALNSLNGEMHSFVREDARSYLEGAVERGERFDLIVIDPPTFSNSRKMEGTFDVQRDYVWFLGQALRLLGREGSVFFSTNFHKFHFDPGRIRGAEIRETTKSTVPPDFDGKKKPHRSWVLKKTGA